ncbi:MAG: hypothetical protein ACYSUQ_00840 [Planctomycetota bacterium]
MEVSGSLILIGMLIGVVVAAAVAYDRAADYYTARHQARLAAESYIERLQADLPPDGDTESDRHTCQNIHYQVTRAPGQGPWHGLTRLTVTATVTARHGREVSFSLSTYLPEPTP